METIGELQLVNQMQITTIAPMERINSGPPQVDKERRDQLQNFVNTSSAHLSPAEKERFLVFMVKYADCFAFPTDPLGRTSSIQHCIDTGHSPPIRQRSRRLPPHQREHVTDLINEMLENHIIQPSSSPWASPIVLVKKKTAIQDFVSITVKSTL